MLGATGGLLGLGYVLRTIVGEPRLNPMSNGVAHADGPGMMGATGIDMSVYMEMFNRHNEIRRTVEEIPGGVRTTTESDSPDLAGLLHTHVPSMYSHLDQGAEIMCMSQSLPTLFRRTADYHRQLTLTVKGVVAVETADDPDLTQAIRAHAGTNEREDVRPTGQCRGPNGAGPRCRVDCGCTTRRHGQFRGFCGCGVGSAIVCTAARSVLVLRVSADVAI